ncbi:MAG: methylmalonyl-CoA epimerase [Elusimicrobiota bacterium]
MKIDHVGIAVKDIESAIRFYAESFGMRVLHREEVASQQVRVAFLAGNAGEASVELLEPVGSGGAIARFIEQRGPGIHHLALHTDRITEDMTRLRAGGTPPIEDAPRPGARGHKVCFLHPKHCEGTLIELVDDSLTPREAA